MSFIFDKACLIKWEKLKRIQKLKLTTEQRPMDVNKQLQLTVIGKNLATKKK